MTPEMQAAFLTAGCTIIGVALGSIGTGITTHMASKRQERLKRMELEVTKSLEERAALRDRTREQGKILGEVLQHCDRLYHLMTLISDALDNSNHDPEIAVRIYREHDVPGVYRDLCAAASSAQMSISHPGIDFYLRRVHGYSFACEAAIREELKIDGTGDLGLGNTIDNGLRLQHAYLSLRVMQHLSVGLISRNQALTGIKALDSEYGFSWEEPYETFAPALSTTIA